MTSMGIVPSVLDRGQGPLASGHEQNKSVNESKCRGWGGGVVGDRRVGGVNEVNRETRRDQNGVHGPCARRAARRGPGRPCKRGSGVRPWRLGDAGKGSGKDYDNCGNQRGGGGDGDLPAPKGGSS